MTANVTRGEGMKRYALEEHETRFAGEWNIDHIMVEDVGGDYVLYSDAQAEIEGYKNGQAQLQSICDGLQDSISKYAAERKTDKAELDRLAAENKRMRVALLTISEGYIFDAKGIALDALTELPSPEVQQTEG